MVEKLTPRLQKQCIFTREPFQVSSHPPSLAIPIQVCSTASRFRHVPFVSSYPRCVKPLSLSAKTKCCAAPKLKNSGAKLLPDLAPDGTTTTVWGLWMASTIAMQKPLNAGSYYYTYTRASTTFY